MRDREIRPAEIAGPLICSEQFDTTLRQFAECAPVMPKFHFNLCCSDQHIFGPPIGYDLDYLAAAHWRAVQIADRVMLFAAFADNMPNLHR